MESLSCKRNRVHNALVIYHVIYFNMHFEYNQVILVGRAIPFWRMHNYGQAARYGSQMRDG